LAPFAERDAPRCATYEDYRQMIDEAKLDAVVIAAPDHHHVLAAMLACRAGLDVYLEKPLSLTIAEGRSLAGAVARFGRILQVGGQQRSMEIDRFACQFVREGGLGRVSLVQMSAYTGPMTYDGLPEEPVPEGLAWDLFCGPAPLRPHNRQLWVKDEFLVAGRLWRGWDLWRDYSGHLMTNWGAHEGDMTQWALGMDHSGPLEVWPIVEGHAGDMRHCPVAARYASGVEIRFDLPVGPGGSLFHGERGKILILRNAFRADPPELLKDPPDPTLAKAWQGAENAARPHVQNWLDCIKTRQKPISDVEIGHRSVSLCHLVNLTRVLGRKLQWDPAKEQFISDDEANKLVSRPRRKGYELPEPV
jgi:predicted dehydrogenase